MEGEEAAIGEDVDTEVLGGISGHTLGRVGTVYPPSGSIEPGSH